MNESVSFPSDPSQEIRLPVDRLQPVLEKMLVRKSMFQFDAHTAVRRMLEADLYGIPAHGCGRIGEYLDALDVGDIDPRGRVLVVEEQPAFAILDGSRSLGHVAATKGAETAAAKARESGIGAALVGNSRSLGAAAVYVRLVAEQGLIGICLSSTGGPTVAAPGTKAGAVGNSPFAYAVPLEESHPLVFDAACGAHSRGKLELLSRYGLPFPQGIAFDSEGNEAVDLQTAAIMRAAGERLGYGLSLLCSILAGPLAGGRMPMHKKQSPSADDSQHFFLALEIARFADPRKFQKELKSTLEEIRQLPPDDPAAPVRVPGDRQMQSFREYSETGIPLHRTVAEEIRRRAEQGKIEVFW